MAIRIVIAEQSRHNGVISVASVKSIMKAESCSNAGRDFGEDNGSELIVSAWFMRTVQADEKAAKLQKDYRNRDGGNGSEETDSIWQLNQ